jgi:16S rRNA C967 or C1407 C5-methylase (RsmB/RsmF family)/NOL1/NOP2/fmu family ribosome biogenesis protein
MEHRLTHSFLQSLENVEGFDLNAFAAVHEEAKSLTSIRFNPNKKIDVQDSVLQIESKIPWSTHGYYLKERPSFTKDPLFHAGAYYVQEASSMFLEQALQQTVDLNASLKVLDLCAAPGGKSTLIQSLISKDSLLVSNEVIKTRVNVLAENITKWGAANVVVTNNDPRDFQRLDSYFDVIVVDAPCSGSGLFRKDPEAINEWSLDNVVLCSQRQQRILADVKEALKHDGILIYSTCSYSEAENENIAEWLITENGFESIQLQVNPEWNIVETITKETNAYGYRFYPDKVKGEGFFIAAFKKTKSTPNGKHLPPLGELKGPHKPQTSNHKHQTTNKQPQTPNAKQTINWLASNELSLFPWKDDILAFPQNLIHEIPVLQSALYIKKAGVNMGSLIRNELIPSHELAMSTILNPDILAVSLDLNKALQFLRLESIEKDFDGTGWMLIKYAGLPLGFIKALPNRINNYYPREWRILNK